MQALAIDPLDGSGPVMLNQALAAGDLTASIAVAGATAMLAYAHEHGGIGLTKGGALNRKFLAWAVEELAWPEWDSKTLHAVNKVIDEGDYLPGAFLHEVLRRTKMLRKSKDRLVLTSSGRANLENPGALAAALFRATCNLRPLSSLDHAFRGGFHSYFGLLLWKLRQVASDWVSVAAAFLACVQPSDPIHRLGAPHERMAEYAFYLRILRPLSWFGLMEVKRHGKRWFDPDLWTVRCTPLFTRFIYFDQTLMADRMAN